MREAYTRAVKKEKWFKKERRKMRGKKDERNDLWNSLEGIY